MDIPLSRFKIKIFPLVFVLEFTCKENDNFLLKLNSEQSHTLLLQERDLFVFGPQQDLFRYSDLLFLKYRKKNQV